MYTSLFTFEMKAKTEESQHNTHYVSIMLLLCYGTPNATKIKIKSRVHPVKSQASEIVECRLKR